MTEKHEISEEKKKSGVELYILLAQYLSALKPTQHEAYMAAMTLHASLLIEFSAEVESLTMMLDQFKTRVLEIYEEARKDIT